VEKTVILDFEADSGLTGFFNSVENWSEYTLVLALLNETSTNPIGLLNMDLWVLEVNTSQ
jgi:hypothetical protein